MTNCVSLGSKPHVFQSSVESQLSELSTISSGDLHELDNMISHIQNVMSLSPRSDPGLALGVPLLGCARLARYTLLQQQDDLEQSILHFTDAIFQPLPWDPRPPFLNVVQIFFFLSTAICFRAKASGQPEDFRCCMVYLGYLRGQRHEVPVEVPCSVTGTLVRALGFHVALELGDVYQDIEKMADLCNELLDSGIATMFLTEPLIDFAQAVHTHHIRFFNPHIPPEKVFGCLRKAFLRLPDNPDSHQVFIVLAESFLVRFMETHLEDDYKEGMGLVNKVIAFGGPGARSPYHNRALLLIPPFATSQMMVHGKPEHLEQAIYCTRNRLDETSLEDPDRPLIIEALSRLNSLRLPGSSATTDRQTALSNISESAELPSFQELIASLPDLNDVQSLSKAQEIQYIYATSPETVERLTDIADIEDGIKYCQQLLTSHPNIKFASLTRITLGKLFYRAFECTDKVEYLNKAISSIRDSINIEISPLYRIALNLDFVSCLSTRFKLFHRREDMIEVMHAHEMTVKHQHFEPSLRFKFACQWAGLSRLLNHPSTSTAYDCAISSMQASLTFAPTLDEKHSQLAALAGIFKSLPLEYASYQISAGRLKQAIETLERGRALLWSEMRGLRPSIDQIRWADSSLAEKFAALNRDLEALILPISSDNNIISGASVVEGMDPFGHIVIQQRKLADDREKLISQIQALPGLNNFLKPLSFDILHSAACHGPVVIINHCKWRSDILILHQNSFPSLIPTPDGFYFRANKLQDELLEERKKGLDSDKYEDTLRFVLRELYDLVGRPLIKRLNELNVPEQSRIWLCPTSVFCSLPLHAMGPIPSDTGSSRYFPDLYIPSYTPSLSALIEARKPGPHAISKPSMLLVAQPDERMPKALKEMGAVQAVDTQVTTLFSARAKPATVLTNLRDHRFVHIVCHGILEPGKPFEASFKLHKGKRLQLLDIVRSQLPDAEFAFLSACHTAELTEESNADEVIHLAAAVQFCGFRSVVGTMWAMADIDGQDLARSFYGLVFSDETKGGHYYERTAEALRDAVKKLRGKGGISLERWVNFVHYGA